MNGPTPFPYYRYLYTSFSLSLFSLERASLVSAIVNNERSSLCSCPTLVPPLQLVYVIVDNEDRDSLPELYHSSF
ncbi:hypothetical protein TIFTF001_002875 [Ficus carica]|uniref:Uncharacterized protein n=1 Tax=Ficus carica TaxID=3494 RepID=A0AA87ZPP6_FICCA|nr:hypothetical protein TIFTF001_002875 [Ficus carica]